jgi:integrase
MGSVRSRIWRGQRVYFIDYVAADGRRIRQTIGLGDGSRRIARQVLAQREAEAILGKHRILPAHTARFAEFAADWLQRVAGRVKPKTLELYEDGVKHHLLPWFGGMRLAAITSSEVESYLAAKSTGTRRGRGGQAVRLAPKTVNITLTLLKQILKDAIEQGLLSESSALRTKPLRDSRAESEQRQFLTPAEVDKLLAIAEPPYGTLYLTAVHTGMRRGELLGLRWRDVDLRTGRIQVRRSLARFKNGARYVVGETPLKTRYSRRTIEDLSSSLRDALLALPAGDDEEWDYVFRSRAGGPMDPDNLDRTFRRHLALAGLPQVRFHDLRHTHASLLIAAGVHPKAIQARLGHASITTTLNTYGHLMPSAFEGVGERLDRILEAGKSKPTEDSANRPTITRYSGAPRFAKRATRT